jgi:hypothetical protein
MADNARFHNKLHRKNHHSIPTPGYPDSATDPIASTEEPFEGNMVVNATVSAQNLWINTDAFIGNNTTIMGNLCVYGTDSYFETFATVTSAMSVINHGFGPALTVKQTGPEPIARFLDGDATGSENALLIADTGQIVINANRPTLDRRVTISGSITASGNTEFQGGSATSSRSFAANDAAANNWDAAAFNTGHADGMRSFAVNYNTLAALSGTFAAGHTTKAIGDFSFSQGMGTVASGLGSHAEGLNTQSTGNNSHSEGITTTAVGSGAHTEGFNTRASGNFSHAEGMTTLASSSGSHSEGIGTVAAGRGSHAEGQNTIVTDPAVASHTEGFRTSAFGFFGHAEGQETAVFGAYNHTEGFGTSAFGINSHAEGYFSYTSGVGVHTEGYATSGLGLYGHAEGYFSTVSGTGAHAEGYGSVAFGPYSHAEGYLTDAFGLYSHTEGSETSAFGIGSRAVGRKSVAAGDYSFAAGEFTYALSAAHAEGNNTQATGPYSHAEGSSTVASGYNSHAEGLGTVASGENSHAEGSFCFARGKNAHAAGSLSEAIGDFSYAGGYFSKSEGLYSYTMGAGTSARGLASNATGYNGRATGIFGYSLGHQAYSDHDMSYCYGTSGFNGQQPVITTRANQYMVSAAGGVYIPGTVGIGTDSIDHALSVNGNASITGNLSVFGDFTYLDTVVSVTSALSVVNTGTGPALTVRQTGTQPIARFIDTDASGVDNMALFVENNGNIGMGTGIVPDKLNIRGNTNMFRLTAASNEFYTLTANRGLSAASTDVNPHLFRGVIGVNTDLPPVTSYALHIKGGNVRVDGVDYSWLPGFNGAAGGNDTDGQSLFDLRSANPSANYNLSIASSGLNHFMKFFGGRTGDQNPFIVVKTNNPLRFASFDNFYNNPNTFTEHMRIDTQNSRVGIGTQSPGARLTVNGSISSNNTSDALRILSAGTDLWSLGFGSGGGALTSDITTDLAVGALTALSILRNGATLQHCMERLLTQVSFPTVSPFASGSMTALINSVTISNGGQVEVGEQTASFTAALNPGSWIGNLVSGVWNPSTFQINAAGAANNYLFFGAVDNLTNTLLTTAANINDGTNSYAINIGFNAGAQPINSKSVLQPAFGPGRAPGTMTITGRRKLFYSNDTSASAPADSSAVRGLTGVIGSGSTWPANGTTFNIPIYAGTKRIVITYPTTFGVISEVRNGLGFNVTTDFTQTTVSVNGANSLFPTNYYVYTYIAGGTFASDETYSVIV